MEKRLFSEEMVVFGAMFMSYYRHMFSFISIAHAASTAGQAEAHDIVGKINNAILFPLIALMMAIAFIVFLYGAFEYVKNANNETARETGRNHLMYGVIGMLVMLSALAILNIAAGTFGLDGELDDASSGYVEPNYGVQ